MFAVTVTFRIKPAFQDRFLPLMRDNARASIRDEAGCSRFDVCTDPARPGDVFLYELYDNAAAFDQHLQTDHFKRFDTAVADMIESKEIVTYETVE